MFSSSLQESRNSRHPKKFFDCWLPDQGYGLCKSEKSSIQRKKERKEGRAEFGRTVDMHSLNLASLCLLPTKPWRLMLMLLRRPQKKLWWEGVFRGRKKKEKELTDYHRSLSLREHRSSWHPKKFVRVNDQSRRVFIEPLRVQKFLGLQENRWLEPGYRRSSSVIVAVKMKSYIYEERKKKKSRYIRWTRTASSPCFLPPVLLKTTARTSSSSFRASFAKTVRPMLLCCYAVLEDCKCTAKKRR